MMPAINPRAFKILAYLYDHVGVEEWATRDRVIGGICISERTSRRLEGILLDYGLLALDRVNRVVLMQLTKLGHQLIAAYRRDITVMVAA